MSKTPEAEKQRAKVHKDAVHVRDALLNAQMMLPSLVAELNNIIDVAKPPKPEKENDG